MSRILRSKTRLKKQQVQHMKEIVLCTNIVNCTVTKIDSLEQEEFLSLFKLIPGPGKQQNGINGHRLPVNSAKAKVLQKQPSKLDGVDTHKRLDDESRQERALEMCIATGKRVQETLLAKKQSILYGMMEAVADKRKYDTFYEQDKQRNIILKLMIAELHKKIIFLCEK